MEIRLLGLIEASHDGHAVPLGGAKPRVLLAMLALHANTPVSADRLIEGLWGEAPPATAPKLVQVLVSQLRKQFAGSDVEIVTRGRGYELRIDPDAVDALRFERLIRSGENGSHHTQALALWRGPPLDDLADEPFAAPEIRRLEGLWLDAREAAIDAALADGREAEALGELDELLRAHPLRERLYGRRMLALYRCGRQAEALEAFRDARRVLLDEVGLEPGPELRRLNEAILGQDADLGDPPLRRLPGRPRQQRRWLFAAAAVALAGAGALAVMLMTGSGGLDRLAQDTTGVIDPASGEIVEQHPVGHAPNAIAAGAGSVWSANGFDGTVSRVGRGDRQLITIPVGGQPTAISFGEGSLWVADGQDRVVKQIDPRTNSVVQSLPAGNGSRGVAVAGGAVWLTSAIDGQVERLDLTKRPRIRRIEVPGGPAAIAAGTGAVWVAGEEDATVTKLDAHSGTALKSIGVGNGPAAIAVGYGGVWVANRDDGTVTRIDATTDTVSNLVLVGGSPVALAAGAGAVWVADGAGGRLIRIDPRTRTVARRVSVGSAPSALTFAGGSLWATAIASHATHRGGTLRFQALPFPCGCFDPAIYGGDDWAVLSLAYDGLVAYRRIPGAGGTTLVADLATSVPRPDDGGRTYSFQLRRGLRFSDGSPVRPEDFRASIERVVRLQSAALFNGISGADACRPQRCDLSAGIRTDARARTITIRLRRPDAEFEHKLASPLASVLPAQAPPTLIRGHPQPGTGPYTVAAFSAKRGVRLVRNARFRPRSAGARPDGFPDAITVAFSKHGVAQVAAVQRGRADAFMVGPPQLPLDRVRALALTDASHVHVAVEPGTSWLFLNAHEPPFDDVNVRRALNYAIDRRRVVELAGGGGQASQSCQTMPPGVPGYRPTCPFTRSPNSAGTWSAPDLAKARRLVAASGSRGARVLMWSPPAYAAVIRYVGVVLRRLGYHVQIRVLRDVDSYFRYVQDTRHHAQAGLYTWYSDFLNGSSSFVPFTCGELARDPRNTANPSQFCDHAVDAAFAAAQAAPGAEANARWAALDRRVLRDAPAVPLFSRREVLLVSDRVGNAQVHRLLGPLLDQFWVR